MQKMESTITGIVQPLLSASTTRKTIKLGPIAVRMIECLKAIHERNNVVRDVKTDNFMLAPEPAGKTTTIENDLASRIRLIDLAMVTQWTPSYRENSESSDLIGTPLYASLNVHGGQKASFRDDLEALGYIIAELIHQLVSGDDTTQLPWAKGSSDHEIGAIKEEQVNNWESDFYGGMGDETTVAIMSEFMTEVKSYTFKQRPSYEKLTNIVAKLETVRPIKASVARRASTKTLKTTTSKRGRAKVPPAATSVAAVAPASTRRKMDSDDVDDDCEDDPMDWDYTDENHEPTSKRGNKLMSSRAQRAARRNADAIVIDDDDDDTGFQNATLNKKSNVKVKAKPTLRTSATSTLTTGLKTIGVVVDIVKGPHAGESFELTSGGCEAVVLGTKPPTGPITGIVLEKDRTLQPFHLKLELSVTRKTTVSVAVTDKSKGNTSINGKAVKRSKAFGGDKISIGETVLLINKVV